MPNHDLQHKTYQVPDSLVSHTNGNSSLTYQNMKKIKSGLDNQQVRSESENELLKWIDSNLNASRDAVDAPKRVRMNAEAPGSKTSVNGQNNNFKKGTHKDNDNANPTAIGGRVDVKSLGKSRNIMNGTADYVKEEYDKEMSDIIYLIEYMNNNNKRKLN